MWFILVERHYVALGEFHGYFTTCKPGTGSTIRFWKDRWHQTSPEIEFPHLFSFAKQQDISLKQLLDINDNNLLDHFHLPLSMIAFQQSENLAARLA